MDSSVTNNSEQIDNTPSDETSETSVSHKRAWLILGIGIFIILILVGGLIILYFVIGNESSPDNGKTCTSDGNCPIGQVCREEGICGTPGPKNCKKNSDCLGTQGCSSGICINLACTDSSQCDANQREACFNETSLSTGSKTCNSLNGPSYNRCNKDKDCNMFGNEGLVCSSNKCVQCKENSDCGDFGICNNGICYNICTSETGKSNSCPSGTTCNNTSNGCCPNTGNCGKTCSVTSDCGGDCPYCINSRCSCVPGRSGIEFGDICTSNSDCASNACSNGACLFTSTDTCVLNFTSTQQKLPVCPSTNPWCFQNPDNLMKAGSCQNTLGGAFCKDMIVTTNGNMESLCYAKASRNDNNIYCVNNFCQNSRGIYGDSCTTTRDCQPGLSCIQGKCLTPSS